MMDMEGVEEVVEGTTPPRTPQKKDEQRPAKAEEPVNADCMYQLKWIPWSNDTFVPIITQNENGPCPLLALCNVLILTNMLHITPGQTIITSQELMNLLGSCLVYCKPKNLSDSEVCNYEQNMQDAIAIFPRLLTGLDVNVKFDSVTGFEFTQELAIFDLLGVPLYHGWLPDPSDSATAALVSSLTYNQLVERAINDATSDDSVKVNEALLLQEFIEGTAAQLTYHGLCELNRVVSEGQFCVFFRNNHFNTMLKRKNQLLLLVTDYGFLNELGHVWQVLSDIDDSGSFLDASFKPSSTTTSHHPVVTTPSTNQRGESDVVSKPVEDTNLDEEIAIGLITEDSEATKVIEAPPPPIVVKENKQTTEQQLLSDEELALRLHTEELSRLQQVPPQPNSREEYEHIAMEAERTRRANTKQSCRLM